MKKYKVEGFSEKMDVEMNLNDIEEVSDLFDAMMESNVYDGAHIMDNETGEVYCYFRKEIECGGVKTIYWTVFA